MEAVQTVQMGATRLLRGVPETALRDTSNVTLVNANRAVTNATGSRIALMGATIQRQYVGQTVRRWKVVGLPATMVNASLAVTNATGTGIAVMAATKIHPSVAEAVSNTQPEARQPTDTGFRVLYFISLNLLIT